jgi:pre-mRNA-splicing factor ATP-dependent RNA helicase DHX15/PRP43
MAIRKTGERVVPQADPNRNPWNGMMYSENYFKLKETRQVLPAYKARQEIIDTVKKYQTVVLQGDTGSGKTT